MFAVCTNRPQAAGGGNAQVRPREYQGDAVGISTGPYRSLDEVIDVASYLKRMVDDGHTLDHSIIDADATTMTAKEIIDKAILRIIRLFLDRRDKDTLYYSQQSLESTNIGLGIFAGMVGADVIEYISKQLRDLPKLVGWEELVLASEDAQGTRGVAQTFASPKVTLEHLKKTFWQNEGAWIASLRRSSASYPRRGIRGSGTCCATLRSARGRRTSRARL